MTGGGHGAATAILIAAGFAGIAVVASLTRLFDFVRVETVMPPTAPREPTALREPAE